MLNEHYFKNGQFFSGKMEPDEKKEFLLDYLNFQFGNEIDGKYFEDNLQDIFNLKQYKLIAEDFDLMIEEYFKNKKIDLNDPEDRKKFKQIIFPQSIKFLNEKEAFDYLNKRSEEIKEENANFGNELSSSKINFNKEDSKNNSENNYNY